MRVSVALVGLVLAVACAAAPPPLEPAFDSPDALARAVVAAYRDGDRDALLRLALTEEEFRRRIWPELPSSRPERNLPFSYVWGDLKQKSDISLTTLVARHRGHPWELVGVRFDEARTPYQSYVVHRKSVFTLRRPGGEAEEVRLCGSMVEQDGRWKVFSYVVDD